MNLHSFPSLSFPFLGAQLKILFSMHVFGDPKQFVEQIQAGVVDFVTITRDEILAGGSRGVGGGVESLVTNVFGGFFSSLGKLTGSVADILDVASNGRSLKFKPVTTSDPPDHAVEGIMQGTLYFTLAMTRGITGVVIKPYNGLKAKSPMLFGEGIATGVAGLVVAPFMGVFGFAAKVSDGISATTRLHEAFMVESRCRPTRYDARNFFAFD